MYYLAGKFSKGRQTWDKAYMDLNLKSKELNMHMKIDL
jgi:hypothetical protein